MHKLREESTQGSCGMTEDLSVEDALLEVGYVMLIDALWIRQCFGDV